MRVGGRRRVRNAVVGALASIGDCDPSTIADDIELSSLGIDSLDFTAVLLDVEDALGGELPLDVLSDAAAAGRFRTVGDIVDALTRRDDLDAG